MRLSVRPVELRDARAFVVQHHRHSEPPVGHRFSVGVEDDEGVLHGVGILGRPVARKADDGRTAEVLRVATDGTPNACSMLYGALVRAAFALGFKRVITYTLISEPGTSLRASGWTRDGESQGGEWKHTTGPRAHDKPTMFYQTKMPTEAKVRWVRTNG